MALGLPNKRQDDTHMVDSRGNRYMGCLTIDEQRQALSLLADYATMQFGAPALAFINKRRRRIAKQLQGRERTGVETPDCQPNAICGQCHKCYEREANG